MLGSFIFLNLVNLVKVTTINLGGTYEVKPGDYANQTLDSQLIINGAAVTADLEFTCVVTVDGQAPQYTPVYLNTYSK